MSKAAQKPSTEGQSTPSNPVPGRVAVSMPGDAVEVNVPSGGTVTVQGSGPVTLDTKRPVYDGEGRRLVPEVPDAPAKPANDNDGETRKTVPVFSGTAEEWAAAVKAKIAAGVYKSGAMIEEIRPGADESVQKWQFVKFLKNGKAFFTAQQDYVEDGSDVHTHYRAEEKAAELGVVLQDDEMMEACWNKPVVRKTFKTDLSYWQREGDDDGARTRWFDDGYPDYHGRYGKRHVRWGLEIQ